MRTADSLVHAALVDGQLEARGRRPGRLEYEAIPRTHWRSTALHMIEDERTLWKMILIPTGGVEFHPDGTMIAHDAAAKERTDHLATYDSVIVNSRQFEKLWPRKDKKLDAITRRHLKAAKKAGVDHAEIEKLAWEGELSFWSRLKFWAKRK